MNRLSLASQLRGNPAAFLLAVILTLAVAACARSQVRLLWDNGTVINGFWGAEPISVISPPNETFGYGAQSDSSNRVADDFISGEGWVVNQFSFYAYQDQSTAFTFSGANVEVRKGDDVNSAATVYSGTNLPVVQVGSLIAYRVAIADPSQTSRSIYKINVAVPDLRPQGGSRYWVIWSLAGSLSGGPWVPQVMSGPAPKPGNAQVSLQGGIFSSASWGGIPSNSAELPFEIREILPEPGTVIALTLGLGVLATRRRRGKFVQ